MTQDEIFSILDEVAAKPRYKPLTEKDRKAAVGELATETELGQWPGDEQRLDDLKKAKTFPELNQAVQERKNLFGQVKKARDYQAELDAADRLAEPSLGDRAKGLAKSVVDKFFPSDTPAPGTPPAESAPTGPIPTRLSPGMPPGPPESQPPKTAPVQPRWGYRTDGTEKGEGFFGMLPSKDKKYPAGTVSSELSVTIDGKLMPLLVPTLTRKEIDSLLEGGPVTDAIRDKAYAHGMDRIAKGLSPFAGPRERVPLPLDLEGITPEQQKGFESRFNQSPAIDKLVEAEAISGQVQDFNARAGQAMAQQQQFRAAAEKVNDLEDELDSLEKKLAAYPQTVETQAQYDEILKTQQLYETKTNELNQAIEQHNTLLKQVQDEQSNLERESGSLNQKIAVTPAVTFTQYPGAEPAKPLTYGDAWLNFGKSLVKGGINVGADMLKWIGIAARDMDLAMSRVPPGTDPKEYLTFQLGTKIRELAEKQFPTRPDLQQNFILSTLPQAIGSSAAFLAGGAAGIAAKAPAALLPMIMGGAAQGAQQYEEATKFKASDAKSRLAFYLGTAVGTSEALPVESLFRWLGKTPGTSALREAVKVGSAQAIVEALQEGGQQLASNAIAWLYDSNRKLHDDVVTNMGAGGAVGFLTGFLLAGSGRRGPAPGGPQAPPTGPAGPPGPAPQPPTEQPAPVAQPPAPQVQTPPPVQAKPKPPRKPAQAPQPAVQAQKPAEPVAPAEIGVPGPTETKPAIPETVPPSGAKTEGVSEPIPVTPVDVQAQAAEPAPTEAQKEAGNYRKGHVAIAGLDVSIENPAGSERSGTDAEGKPWSTTMQDHYGYIKGTKGKDKDHLDVFIKPGTPEDYDGPVFVIDQKDPKTGKFDEHKIIMGPATVDGAIEQYKRNYAKDWQGIGSVKGFTMAEFKDWLKNGDHTKPAGNFPSKAEAKPEEKIEYTVQPLRPGATPETLTLPAKPSTPAYTVTEAELKPVRQPDGSVKWVATETGKTEYPAEGAQAGPPGPLQPAPGKPGPLRPGEEISGQAWRADSGFSHSKDTKASDVIKFESEENGNEDVAQMAAEAGIDLSNRSAKDLIWVTREKKDAQRYGQAEEFALPEGTRVIVPDDGDGGMLVLLPDTSTQKIDEKPDRIIQGSDKLATIIANHLESEVDPFDKDQLWAWADESFGGTKADGTYTAKDAYDAVELAVNRYLEKALPAVSNSAEGARSTIDWIRKLMDRLPTMGRYRTEGQEQLQQFSTPPDLAYAMNWLAGIKKGDVVLEPSAGVGGLAVFGKVAGATVHVNEYDPRRANLLKLLGLTNITQENAEHLNRILAPWIKPTVVVMNPPFSTSPVRSDKTTKNAVLHLAQAFARLQPGGRLVALVGKNKFGTPEKAINDWLASVGKQNTVQAQIGLSGKFYKKYGTEYDNQILIVDKVPPPEGHVRIVKENANDVKDVLAELTHVREARLRQQLAAVRSDTPAGPAVVGQGAGEARPQPGSGLPTDVVGPGSRPGTSQPQLQGTTPGVSGVPGPPTGEPERRPGVSAPTGGQPGAQGQSKPARPSGKSGIGQPSATTRPGQRDVSGSEGGGMAPSVSKGGVELEQQTEETHGELTDSLYDDYKPKKLSVKGAKPHPAVLVESAAMAAVNPPDPTYTPNLDAKTIANGDVSLAQLESTVYAGMAHEQMLPNGERMGFFIGDGTGVGKGREVAAIILDNWRRGRKKAVWVSEKSDLVDDAIRDWTGLGGDGKNVTALSKWAIDQKVNAPEGVMFLTYDTLKSGLELSPAGNLRQKGTGTDKPGTKIEPSRLDQLVQWLGPDYDGVLMFDEAHNMGNSIQLEEEGGGQFKKGGKVAMKALAGVELQKRLPKARVVYVSATGATNVENLAYAERLGLWGKGTPFPDKADFINKIKSQGLAAMELVAQELKSRGLYLSRSISYHDVTFSELEHIITPAQQEIYNAVARAWQIILRNIDAALALTGGMKSRAKAAARGRLWSTQLRTFNFLMTSMQMPTVLEQMKKDLAAGHAVVIQLTNTNDAQAQQAIGARKSQATQGEDIDLDGIDITPKAAMLDFLKNAFPTQQYEETEDENGNTIMVPVTDSQGNAVHNEEAVRLRDELIRDVDMTVQISEGPLEAILNTFGPERVAEITGRKSRLFRHPETGKMVEEKRGEAALNADRKAFNDGRKDILIFSEKGGTGKSYHADLNIKNQKKRMHHAIQAGWRADKFMQGLGRTHRSNQKQAPHYYLAKTNLKGHKRFITSIARRLEQLGSLTRGQRQTGSSGLISAADNLENEYALRAVHDLIELSFRGQIPAIPYKPIIEEKMGLELIDRQANAINKTKLPDVPKFLNRILNLELDEQNTVFDEFDRRRMAMVEAAAAKGLLDVGAETVRAQSVKKLNEQVVYADKARNAETKLVQLELRHKAYLVPSAEVEKHQGFMGYMTNIKSEHRYAVVKAGIKTKEDGSLTTLYKRFTVVEGHYDYVEYRNDDELKQHYTIAPLKEGREKWDDDRALHPGYYSDKMNLLVGTMLQIWDRLPQNFIKVKRVQTDEGQRFLGRQISNNELGPLLERLGAEVAAPKLTPAEAMEHLLGKGDSIILANGWKLERRTVANEKRVELGAAKGPSLGPHSKALQSEGVRIEKIGSDWRYFIPNAGVYEKLTQFRPIARLIEAASNERGSVPVNPFAKPAPEAVVGVGNDDGKFHSSDPEIEARYTAATKGIGKTSLLDKLKGYWEEFSRKISSEFQYLPDTAEFSPLRTALLRLQKQKAISADLMLRDLESIVGKLSDPKLDLLTRKVQLMDFQQEALADRLLPYGYTPERVEIDLEEVDRLLTLNPDVRTAWEKREALWAGLKTDYVRSMHAIGFDVTQKVTKEHYFRHQVMQYATEIGNTKGTGQRVRTPTGRSFLKKREGSTFDINANLIQAEFEVLTQMHYDIRLAEVIKLVDDVYNIQPQLVESARKQNELEFKKELNARGPESPLAEEWKLIRSRLGMHMNRLRQLLGKASTDLVPIQEIKAIADDSEHPGNGPALGVFKWIDKRRELIKTTLGPRFKTWEDLIPENYETFQPREGNLFYMVDAIPHQMLLQLQEKMGADLGIPPDKLRSVLAMGSKREQFVVPLPVHATLTELKHPEYHTVQKAWAEVQGSWKAGKLIGPHSMLKYNIRNLTGDAEATFVGNPAAFKRVKEAIVDLWPVFTKKGKMQGHVKDWFERGGMGTLLQVNEMGDLNDLAIFKGLAERSEKGGAQKAAAGLFNTWWKGARLSTDFREAILRYANYREYLAQIEEAGKPKNYGASIPASVDILTDPKDKAFKLSNELIGAYDRISVAGQHLRRYWIPFWSWKEVNFVRYKQLIKNAFHDRDYSAAGRLTVGRTAMTTAQAARILLKVSFVYGMLQLWNHLFFPDEERELNERTRNRVHIVLGRTDDGKIVYFDGIGALGDLLSWVGLDSAASHLIAGDIMHDRMTLRELATDMLKAPFNVMAQSLGPLPAKLPAESFAGKSAFPDVFNPQAIRDLPQHLANQLTPFGPEIAAARGKPGRPYGSPESMLNMVASQQDPGQAAYHDWQTIEDRWRGRMGKPSFGSYQRSPRGQALADWAAAIRYKDTDAEAKYKKQFSAEGGTVGHIKQSLRNLAPLSGLTKDERAYILGNLDNHEKTVLKRAEQYYLDHMLKVLPLHERASLMASLIENGGLSGSIIPRKSLPPQASSPSLP